MRGGGKGMGVTDGLHLERLRLRVRVRVRVRAMGTLHLERLLEVLLAQRHLQQR